MTITALPIAPSRGDDPETFATRADAFVAALPVMVSEINADIGGAVVAADAAALSAVDAAISADAAALSAQSAAFKGEWSSLTGALAIPASVYHNNSFWILLASVADVTAHEPSISASWVRAKGGGGTVAFMSFIASSF